MIPAGTTLYTPMTITAWEDAPIDVDGKRLKINNHSDTVGYIPVYRSIEKLRERHGSEMPYNTFVVTVPIEPMKMRGEK